MVVNPNVLHVFHGISILVTVLFIESGPGEIPGIVIILDQPCTF